MIGGELNCSGLMLRLRNVQLPKHCGKSTVDDSMRMFLDYLWESILCLWLVSLWFCYSVIGCPQLGKGPCQWGDQFEVSECKLPGPSVGEITEDGVITSCHPPLPWKQNRYNKCNSFHSEKTKQQIHFYIYNSNNNNTIYIYIYIYIFKRSRMCFTLCFCSILLNIYIFI